MLSASLTLRSTASTSHTWLGVGVGVGVGDRGRGRSRGRGWGSCAPHSQHKPHLLGGTLFGYACARSVLRSARPRQLGTRSHRIRSGAERPSALVLRRTLVQTGQGARRGELPGGLLISRIRCVSLVGVGVRRWVREVAGWVCARCRHARHDLSCSRRFAHNHGSTTVDTHPRVSGVTKIGVVYTEVCVFGVVND